MLFIMLIKIFLNLLLQVLRIIKQLKEIKKDK